MGLHGDNSSPFLGLFLTLISVLYAIVLRSLGTNARLTICDTFIQMLSDRIMVRVGGGWKSLDHFLLVHDPCRIEEMRLCKLRCQAL